MYHDQGLAPFKLLHFADGVNFTAGLPFVRTSPDHGTAHDIAGRGAPTREHDRGAAHGRPTRLSVPHHRGKRASRSSSGQHR